MSSPKYSFEFVYCRNHTSYENFKLKLCTGAQSIALGTRTKFKLGILTLNVFSDIVYFCKIILENVSETNPSALTLASTPVNLMRVKRSSPTNHDAANCIQWLISILP